MKKKPNVFVSLDDEMIAHLISLASRTIAYASSSISETIAMAITAKRLAEPNVRIVVIIDADPQTLRLGLGELNGVKLLWESGIEIRCAPKLRIGALIVDDMSWILTPTPEIVLDQPEPDSLNAVKTTPRMTKWLIYAMAPMMAIIDQVKEEIGGGLPGGSYDDENDSDDVGSDDPDGVLGEDTIEEGDPLGDETEAGKGPVYDLAEPEIGTEPFTAETMDELNDQIESRPPRKFDHEREILVYNSYLQFVDMKFIGGRLSSRVIEVPKRLLKLVDNEAKRIEITARFRLFENAEDQIPAVRAFEQKVNEVRRCYTHPLGNDLGSVILARMRKDFDKELRDLQDELEELRTSTLKSIGAVIEKSKTRVIDDLLPFVVKNPPKRFGSLYAPDESRVREYLDHELYRLLPEASRLIEKMELLCVFKDVTWEMLNDEKFGKAIKERFPEEDFTKLYGERNTIGEREPKTKREFTDAIWPDLIDEPF